MSAQRIYSRTLGTQKGVEFIGFAPIARRTARLEGADRRPAYSSRSRSDLAEGTDRTDPGAQSMHHAVPRLAIVGLGVALFASAHPAAAQRPLDSAALARRFQLESELESVAVIDRKEMLRMRDGVRLATDIYRPKDAAGPVPAIFVRTPDDGNYTLGRYNYTWWDVRNSAPHDMTAILNAVKRGYAYVEQNERGHFFSEGNYDILGPPRTDGYDAIQWISAQPWSNGKVGLIGCSSTAEWQMGWRRRRPPGWRRSIPRASAQASDASSRTTSMGNWYRGGAVQMLFIDWLYGEQNQVRPMFPANLSQADLIRGVQRFRSGSADAASGLGGRVHAPARAGHYQVCRRATGDLRRLDAGRHRRAA